MLRHSGEAAAASGGNRIAGGDAVGRRRFVHDPATISAFRYSLSLQAYTGYGTHFRTIAGYVVSNNTDGLATTALF